MSNIKKKINGIIVGYISVALLYQIIWLIAPVRAFLFDTGLDAVSSGLAMLGFALFLWDAFTDRVFLKSRYTRLLIAVIAVLCLSSLVNINYGFGKNAKVIIWQIVQMLVMFPLCYRIKDELHERFFVTIHTISSAVFVPASLLSIYQFCFNISYDIIVDGSECRQGFQDGRAFGVFASIYYASLFLSVMAVATLYLALKAKNTGRRVLYSLESILFIIYIIISGTRSVQVGLFTALFVGAFIFFKGNDLLCRKLRSIWLRSGVCLVLSVITLACGMLAYSTAERALDAIPLYIEKVTTEQPDDTADSSAVTDKVTGTLDSSQETGKKPATDKKPTTDKTPTTDKKPSTDKKPVVVDRPDTTEDNISNHRFQIWMDYLQASFNSIKSAVFGYGPGSYMDAIKETSPDSFIVSRIKEGYPAMYEQGYIYDTHNSYLSILVTCGVIGLLAVGVFLIICFKNVLVCLFSKQKPSGTVVALTLLLVVIMATVFFDSDMFFKCTDTSMIFWVVSGFLLKRVDAELKKAPTVQDGQECAEEKE